MVFGQFSIVPIYRVLNLEYGGWHTASYTTRTKTRVKFLGPLLKVPGWSDFAGGPFFDFSAEELDQKKKRLPAGGLKMVQKGRFLAKSKKKWCASKKCRAALAA